MKLASRGSDLALWQARRVADGLAGDADIVTVETEADRFEGDVSDLGHQGVFVRELDLRVADGDVDGAVHSMKDMPTERPEGVEVAAVLERGPAYDALVSLDGHTIDDLPEGAVVGTSSARRKAQVERYRDDVEVEGLRGNVDTRVERLRDGDYDAVVLSSAGLDRLDIDVPREELPPSDFVPAANQGVVAVVAREDTDAFERLRRLDHKRTRVEATAERTVLSRVGGGCIAPMGVYAVIRGEYIEISAEVVSSEGDVSFQRRYPVHLYVEGAREIADDMVDEGARALMEES
ncbi:MAG: hydroxymethylbilane synthase [Halobacteriota archaeon]